MADAQNDWIARRVDTAREACPIAGKVASVIKFQMQGTMRERTLRPVELTAIAKILLNAVNNPPDKEAAK